MMVDEHTQHDDEPRSRNPWIVAVILAAVAFMGFMWIYAFFFAPDDGINRIEDRAWSERAEATCAEAKQELIQLADYRTLEEVGGDALRQRADIVERTNQILTGMVDRLAADRPQGDKASRVVPNWLADWRTYIGDRQRYVEQLRAGDGGGFAETEVNGSPISNFIGDMARQNEMPSCQVPIDLAN